MEYLLTATFLAFLIANIYIVRMNRKASIKRSAFRACTVGYAAFMAVYLSITMPDKILLLVVLPVLAAVTFGILKFTKFCGWCGRMIKTNLPFRTDNRCPRCGTEIS